MTDDVDMDAEGGPRTGAGPQRAPSVSVVIPTVNRPKPLRNALASAVAQTTRPAEVVVVDDGAEDEASLRRLLEGTGIRLVYVKKDRRGVCRSRNQGVLASGGDILVFIDDDVVMQPGYIEAFLRAFQSDSERRIGGLTGRMRRFKNGVRLPEDHAATWEDVLGRFFLFVPPTGGQVLPSGFRRTVLWPSGRVPVEFLQGGNMAVRREVFADTSFDETLDHQGGGYALGEDVQFSYPLRRRWEMFAIEDAVCDHVQAHGGRPDPYLMARMRVIHTWNFVRRFMDPGLRHRAAFAWAVLGLAFTSIVGVALSPRSDSLARLRGTLAGALHVMRHTEEGKAAPPPGLFAPGELHRER